MTGGGGGGGKGGGSGWSAGIGLRTAAHKPSVGLVGECDGLVCQKARAGKYKGSSMGDVNCEGALALEIAAQYPLGDVLEKAYRRKSKWELLENDWESDMVSKRKHYKQGLLWRYCDHSLFNVNKYLEYLDVEMYWVNKHLMNQILSYNVVKVLCGLC